MLCPCHSQNKYEDCCEPFHKNLNPSSALLLMRSRYSAYALSLTDYIALTTHPASPHYKDNKFIWKKEIKEFCKNTVFENLEILDFQELKNSATVTFKATLSQDGKDISYTETSYFEKYKDRWLYLFGRHLNEPFIKSTFNLLPLAYYGDEVLRLKAKEIIDITEDIKTLVDQMIFTMDASEGMGIAAPQVHHSLRLFIIRIPLLQEDNTMEYGDVKVFINPIITDASETTWIANEGCLSIPGVRLPISRHKELTIEYSDLSNKRIKETISGWQAKVIQHEYDHIEGILHVDRAADEYQEKLKSYLANLEKRFS